MTAKVRIPDEIEKARDEAERAAAMPNAAMLERIGLQQMAAVLAPDVLPVDAWNGHFAREGRRDRDAVLAFLHRQATRWTDSNGMWRSLTSDRARFDREVAPKLDALGAGPESHIKYLRVNGAWSGV